MLHGHCSFLPTCQFKSEVLDELIFHTLAREGPQIWSTVVYRGENRLHQSQHFETSTHTRGTVVSRCRRTRRCPPSARSSSDFFRDFSPSSAILLCRSVIGPPTSDRLHVTTLLFFVPASGVTGETPERENERLRWRLHLTMASLDDATSTL